MIFRENINNFSFFSIHFLRMSNIIFFVIKIYSKIGIIIKLLFKIIIIVFELHIIIEFKNVYYKFHLSILDISKSVLL